MDADALKRKLDAAREFEVEDESIAFKMRMPTETAMRAAVMQLQSRDSRSAVADLQPILMRQCVIGWRGLRPCDLLEGMPELPLEFDASLLDDVFDRWPTLYDKAYGELMERWGQRMARFEAERKN